jgi:Fe-S-cluster formation regulator IscX/YfhJ
VKWTSSEDIGIALYEKYPDPKSSNEPKLEAIQMAWYEEWKDNQ